MHFEWGERKRRHNLAEHGINFVAVGRIFDQTEDRRRNDGEARMRVLGAISGQIIQLVYSWDENRRRLISPRKARRDEREIYSLGSSDELVGMIDRTDSARIAAMADLKVEVAAADDPDALPLCAHDWADAKAVDPASTEPVTLDLDRNAGWTAP